MRTLRFYKLFIKKEEIKMINNDQQQTTTIVNYGIERVYYAVIKGAESISSFTIKSANKITYSISISVGMSFSSWGEIMNVSLLYLDENRTKIDIRSVSKIGSLLGANYKNRENIDKILNAMSFYLQQVF